MGEQLREFQTYPLDQQIDIHLAATTRLHPPDYRFGGEIARRGREAIPPLLARLKVAQEDRERFDILFIFASMAQLYEPVAADEDVVAALREAVGAMRDLSWKRQAEILLERITIGRSDFFRVPERPEGRE